MFAVSLSLNYNVARFLEAISLVEKTTGAAIETTTSISVNKKQNNGAIAILRFQLFGLALLILALTIFAGAQEINLVFTGGLICVIPTLIFARLIFRTMPSAGNAQQVRALTGSLYVGELLKLILTISLFALAFMKIEALQTPANVIYLFAGYLITQLSSLFGARFQQKNIESSDT